MRRLNYYIWILPVAVMFSAGLSSSLGTGSGNVLKQSVVKLTVTTQRADYKLPWEMTAPAWISASGFVISQRRILTNAHIVSDARFIEVQKEGNPRKYQARVLFIGHDCDLAVLTVDDQGFFEGTKALSLGESLPELNAEVLVVGYPIGGLRFSVTRGVVSRIDYSLYSHSGVDSHLVIQVDAAINPGNSGGPVLFDGNVVGLAFQGLFAAENIGYAIPLPVIRHFLTDVDDGQYHGFPELGVVWKKTRNPALRKDLGLPKNEIGVAVDYVDPFGSALNFLRPRDVLLAIDDHSIAYDGTILLDGNTVEFMELMERKQCGESVSLVLWRDSAKQNVTIPLKAPKDSFIFRREYDKLPEYFIAGGLVFSPLTSGYLAAVGRHLVSLNARYFRYYVTYAAVDGLYRDRDQFVVLIRRLAHPCNTYADQFINGIVSSVNGKRIRRIQDVKEAMRLPLNGFHVIRFEDMDNALVLDAERASEADSAILATYGIPSLEHFEND